MPLRGFFWLWCATPQHRAFVTLPSQRLYLQNLSFLKGLLSMQSFHFRVSMYMSFDRSDKNSRVWHSNLKLWNTKHDAIFFSYFLKANCISSSWEITVFQMKFTLEMNRPSLCDGKGSWGNQLQSWQNSPPSTVAWSFPPSLLTRVLWYQPLCAIQDNGKRKTIFPPSSTAQAFPTA